jgi:hypothetical protein
MVADEDGRKSVGLSVYLIGGAIFVVAASIVIVAGFLLSRP